jgi:hypothetical protein
MDNNENGTGGASNSSATPPEQTVEYWKQQASQATSRYNGMNGKFQQLQGQYAALEETHKGVQTALTTASQEMLQRQSAIADWEGKYNLLNQQHGQLSGKLTEAEKAAATAATHLERLTVIAEKNRDLLDFWPMLRDLPGDKDAFMKNVDDFGTKLGARMQSAVKQTMSGATLPTGAGKAEGAIDKDAAYKAVDVLIRQGVTSGPEYDAAIGQWEALSGAR